MDQDLRSIQQARALLTQAREAQHQFKTFSQTQVDAIVEAMVAAGVTAAERLGQMAHEETGFGRPESKTLKNLFATRTLYERMEGMKTVGIIRRDEEQRIWEIATPMGVVAALIPSTNPTSTAMYKAIISAKARCGIVMSPHPRAQACTEEALRVVAEAAYAAGAPKGLFGCMTEVALAGTNELLEHAITDVILATGGGAMVRAAHSVGKPAYGVGSGNVPAYVDRSANIAKAAADLVYGASFDWGTLCSTERSIVADMPIRTKLKEALQREGAYILNEAEKAKLRSMVLRKGRLNTDQVGQSPAVIAQLAGFSVPASTRALIAEVDTVGKAEPLSMETLSPIMAFFVEDGWERGCKRCIEVLKFGGIGHTLAIHAQSERVIEAFALQKPAMRIVVNTVSALGSVGYTTRLFPAMTLGPGTIGGSITSDNISPMHLLNIKRMAFETNPVTDAKAKTTAKSQAAQPRYGNPVFQRTLKLTASKPKTEGSWLDTIEARLLARAGNPHASPASLKTKPASPAQVSAPLEAPKPASNAKGGDSHLALPESQIADLIQRFRK